MARARRLCRAASMLLVSLMPLSVSVSALADSAPSGDPAAAVAQARTALAQAQAHAVAEDSALLQAQQNLAAAQQRLAGLIQQVAILDARVQADEAVAQRLQRDLATDRASLAAYLRASYEGGLDASFAYMLAASSFNAFLQRHDAVNRVSQAADDLVQRIVRENDQAQQALQEAQTAQAQARVAQEQAATVEALVAVEEQQAGDAAAAAHHVVAQSQAQVTSAEQAKAAWDAQQAALAAQRSSLTFQPIPGATFTVDTDLRIPSGLNASEINSFLQGTALQGLGSAYMAAEHDYQVSARYLVAHSIEESAWGTSAIARDKNNLFGFGADDAHPYQDAYTFSSFAQCIDYVAHYVAVNYLTPGGRYYHGPTLRGMNVAYASGPNWANNIARIADTIPPAT